MTNKINTIIFDLEGVIVDSEIIWDTADRVFLCNYGAEFDRTRDKHLLAGKSFREGTDLLKWLYKLPKDLDVLAVERMDVVKECFRTEIKEIKGFRDFYSQIRHSHKTCVATAMHDELLKIADESIGLTELFGANLFSVSKVNNVGKPAPDIFLYAGRQVNAKPYECLVIEDAPHGIEAARRAGMKSIGIATTFPRAMLSAATQVVNSFAEINFATI